MGRSSSVYSATGRDSILLLTVFVSGYSNPNRESSALLILLLVRNRRRTDDAISMANAFMKRFVCFIFSLP
jgi:hypothetical protein